MPDYRESKLQKEQAKEFENLTRQANIFNAAQAERARLTRYVSAQAKLGLMTDQEAARAIERISTFTDSANMHSQRLAKTLNVNSLSWQNVSEAIANATLKVGLWMVATTAVMGITRKITEVVQLWKDLQITLERIGITTSTSGKQLAAYFDLAADAAIRMGMPIQDTLKGLDLTLRATASLEDQAQRTATAELMLRDAAILGNVAGMSFAQATDILVGSLKQTGMSLDQGIVLLDKWVAVAKTAQVSINDLSQGFAIMASAAEDAGVNIDQINGIIAALSETVTLGPVEVGNAIRALMSTLYNPGSITTLRKYGVAVEDATGNFRSFWEIMSELSAMQLTGALSENQLLEIAKAAGAGQRRYAQFIALLKNWNTAIRESQISADAFGDALSANDRIINTLTNAWDQFTAAQNKMWYNLGNKSGLIDDLTKSFQTLANIFSTLGNMSGSVAVLIKLIVQLTTALIALKVAEVALVKTGVAAAITGWARSTLPAIKNLRLLAGFGMGGAAASMAGVGGAAASQAQWARLGLLLQKEPDAMKRQLIANQMNAIMQKQNVPGMTGLTPAAAAAAQKQPFPGVIAPIVQGPKYRAGAGGISVAGAKYGGGMITPLVMGRGAEVQPTAVVTGLTRGQIAGGAWANVGTQLGTQLKKATTAMTAPMRGMGLAFGTVAAGAIMKELYQSNWAGIGGGIGGAIGGVLGGPVGMVAGSFIGGAIAKMIEQAGMSFEDKVAAERARWMKDVPDSVVNALAKVREQLDLSKTVVIPLEELRKGRKEDIAEQIEKARKSLSALEKEYAEASKPGFPQSIIDLINKGKSLTAQIEDRRRFIAEAEEAQRRLNEETKTQATVYDEIAGRAQIIRNELGLQSSADERIADIKARSLELTSEELQDQLSLAASAPITYSKILAQVERLEQKIPGITEQFKKMIPDYETFIKFDPKAYAPFIDVLGTITAKEQAIREATESIAAAQKLLNELIQASPDVAKVLNLKDASASIDNMTAAWQYWSDVQQEAQRGVSLEKFYEGWNIDIKDGTKAAEQALNFLNGIVNALAKGKEATQLLEDAQNEYDSSVAITEARFKHIGEYVEPGQLEFFDIGYKGLDRLGSLIEKYETMFGRYIDSQDQVYHAFIRDEQGAIQGIIDTFVAQPEVWQAAIAELQAINQNTAKMVEAEYNIPSWYAKPSRYWYYKTTGSTEFGPTQTSLWALWEKFARENSMQTGGTVPQTGPYYLHAGEIVSKTDSFSRTNNILAGSHQILLVSQGYLAQINLGIIALRNELAALRTNRLTMNGDKFAAVTSSGMGGDIPTFGARGYLK